MKTVERGIAIISIDGKRYTTERDVERVSDIRNTILGPMEFGYVRFGPQRWVRLPDVTPQPL